MKSLKDIIQNLYEKTDYYKYEKIRGEWEEQNIKIDEQQSEINKLNRKYIKLKKEYEQYTKGSLEALDFRIKEINKLEELNIKTSQKLKDKEKERRKLAGKIGGYQKQINKLEMQVEFLKTNRRSPSLEELKDYELKRKRSVNNE